MHYKEIMRILTTLLILLTATANLGCLDLSKDKDRSISRDFFYILTLNNFYQIEYYAYIPVPVNGFVNRHYPNPGQTLLELSELHCSDDKGNFSMVNIDGKYYLNVSGQTSFIIKVSSEDNKSYPLHIFDSFSSDQMFFKTNSNRTINVLMTIWCSIQDESILWEYGSSLDDGWQDFDIQVKSSRYRTHGEGVYW